MSVLKSEIRNKMLGNYKKTIEIFCENIKGSLFFKNTAQIVIGNIIGQILSVLFMPVISRTYGPILFGEYGVFTATINIVNALVCLGLVSAIVSPEEDSEASAIYKICLISCSTFAIVLLTLSMAFAPIYHVIEVSINYYLICILMAIFIVVNNLFSMTYIWGNRKKNYTLLMYNPIIAAVTNFVVVVILASIGFKSIGLVIGAIFSQVAVLVHLLIHLKPLDYKHTFNDLKLVLIKYKDFPKYQMPSNFLKVFGSQFPILIMSFYFGSSFVGQYTMGQRLLYLPIVLIGGAMGQIHFKQASDMVNSGQDIGEFTYKAIKVVSIIAFIPLLICAIFGEFIFEIFLGSQWGIAGTVAQIRSFEFLFTCMFFSVSYILVVLKKQKMALAYTIFALLLNNLVVYIGASSLKNELLTVFMLSISSAILNILFLLYAFYQTEYGPKKYLKLVLYLSLVFIIIAISGNYIMRGYLY